MAAQTVAYYLMVTGGLYGEEHNLQYGMQANTIKKRRVLALWRVGRRLLLRQMCKPADWMAPIRAVSAS